MVLLTELTFCDLLFHIGRSSHSVGGNVLHRLQHAMLFPFPVILKGKLEKIHFILVLYLNVKEVLSGSFEIITSSF